MPREKNGFELISWTKNLWIGAFSIIQWTISVTHTHINKQENCLNLQEIIVIEDEHVSI